MNIKMSIYAIKAVCLALILSIAPGCCWGGCIEKMKPCPPCNPCKPCNDSCVIKEPKKSNRSYQKNILEQREDADEDEEIIELGNEF